MATNVGMENKLRECEKCGGVSWLVRPIFSAKTGAIPNQPHLNQPPLFVGNMADFVKGDMAIFICANCGKEEKLEKE